MLKKTRSDKSRRFVYPAVLTGIGVYGWPSMAHAIQFHASVEGIITHQIGHLFFLFSMLVLIVTINGKGLDRQRGWRLIQYSALFFFLWNCVTVLAHFLDNQVYAVRFETISPWQIQVVATNKSIPLARLYYWLKLDHLLCVPAILLLYKGLSRLVKDQEES